MILSTESHIARQIKWEGWVDPWLCARYKNEIWLQDQHRNKLERQIFLCKSRSLLGCVDACKSERFRKFSGCEICRHSFRNKELRSNWWTQVVETKTAVRLVYGNREDSEERKDEQTAMKNLCRSCFFKMENINRKARTVRDNFYPLSQLEKEISNVRKGKQSNQNNGTAS